MKIHILGIAGTFMAGIATLAKEMGHDVHGSDQNIYPPMNTQLDALGIQYYQGYQPENLSPKPDYVVIGNAMKRGYPVIEHVLNSDLRYTSGPQWLAEHVLAGRQVIAVAGTHGKTTTSSMIAWILEYAGLKPGFLIGGIPNNFALSARVGGSRFFVIEADEYDSAFFDKRSKFIHYHPNTVILNNLEFDHADIFENLNAIQTQFHHLVRTIPSQGLIIAPKNDAAIAAVLEKGCWTPISYFNGIDGNWQAHDISSDGRQFAIHHQDKIVGRVNWSQLGQHNVSNALAAIAASEHVGVPTKTACEALNLFQGVKRRMELRGVVNDITVYDDFGHHPTAIATTLSGLRHHVGANARILAMVDFGSYTMRMGVHAKHFDQVFDDANMVFLSEPANCQWNIRALAEQLPRPASVHHTIPDMIKAVCRHAQPQDYIVILSNTGFDGAHEQLLTGLKMQ